MVGANSLNQGNPNMIRSLPRLVDVGKGCLLRCHCTLIRGLHIG